VAPSVQPGDPPGWSRCRQLTCLQYRANREAEGRAHLMKHTTRSLCKFMKAGEQVSAEEVNLAG
jgi:hypothetical protein